jgi:hypothetical protein
MRNLLLRAVAIGAAVIVSVAVASPSPAGAATTLRDATIATQENVGGKLVRYNAVAVYDASTPGVATVVCNSVVVGVPIDVPTSTCWLDDLDSDIYYFAYTFPYFQSSYNVGAFVIDHPSRLRLCMRVDFIYAGGPTRCQDVS